MQEPFLKKSCSHCGFGNYVETHESGDWWLSCNECHALYFCYVPMDHQYEFHKDSHKLKAFFGGFGSAKTSTCAAELIKLTLETPNGTSLVGAATLPQLEQTAKKDLMSMLHPSLIETYSVQKNYIDLTNGHRILFRPLDSEGKARSLNLCFVWIEEASEVNFDYIVQLQTRLRNHATNRHQMLISSNPDLGHVRTEFLLKADKIYGAQRNYFVPEEDKNPDIAVHIAATHLNKYLPIDYYHSTARGKPRWWIERYLNASFEFAEGAVYQDFSDHIVKPFEIPDHWERIGGSDWGIRDYTVLLMGAIDPETGIVYIYKEYYKNGLPVPVHAKAMKEIVQEVPIGKLRVLVGDPSGKKKGITDMRSIFDHYAEYGLWFKDGNNRIDAGIAKVQAYMSLGRLKIFNNCVNLIREGLNYKYKPQELDATRNADEKPVDKDNHACFIAGTLIETINGLVPIEDVKTGDKVWTRQGYKRVYDSALTGRSKKVYRVEFSNGTSITATGNHPIFVDNKGFLAIDSLRYSDIIKVSEHWEELKCINQKSILSNGTVKNGEDIQILNIQAIKDTIRIKQSGCIEKCGNIIVGKYLKGITFTTKTITHSTILLKTLNLLKRRNTLNITPNSKTLMKISSNSEKLGLKRLRKKQLIGTVQKKEKSGIDNTLTSQLLNNLKLLNQRLATTVSLILNPLMLRLNFVPITVNPLGEGYKDLMMSKEHVSFAKQISPSTSTEQRKHAHGSVQVVSVKELSTTHDVYNISVEEAHEYYANGVLSHNCDAMRYMVSELPDDPANLIQKSYQSRNFAGKTDDGTIPYALQSEEKQSNRRDLWLYY